MKTEIQSKEIFPMKRFLDFEQFFKYEFQIAQIFYLIVLAYCIFRLNYGVSVVDETLYVALGYLPSIGGKWFVNDHTVQGTSALFFCLPIRAYAYFFGTEGILLFSRYLYLASALLVSALTYKLFARFISRGSALALSIVPVLFIGHGISSLYYNGSGSLLFGTASIFMLLSVLEQKRFFAFFSGVAWAACCFVYPSFIVVYIFVLATFITKNFKGHRDLVFGFVQGSIVGGLPWLIVLLDIGIDNVKSVIVYSSNFNQPGALHWKITKTMNDLEILYGKPFFYLLGSIIFWGYLEIYKKQHRYLGILAFTISYFLTARLYSVQPAQVFWILLEFMVFIPWFLRRKEPEVTGDTKYKQLASYLIFPAMLGSVVTLFTSLQMISNTYITGVFGALALFIYTIKEHKIAYWVISCVLIFNIHFWYSRLAYEDNGPDSLSYKMETGPFKGLHTNPKKGAFIDQLQDDLKILPSDKTILFKDQFPSGYLMTKNPPAGPTINLLDYEDYPHVRAMYKEIYQDDKNLPDLIVELTEFPVRSNQLQVFLGTKMDFSNDPFNDFFMRSGKYKIILDKGIYRFLQRADNTKAP